MIQKRNIKSLPLLAILSIVLLMGSCGIYKFKDVSIPPDIKTVKVNYIENRARYINPQLSPQLSDRLRQKIVGQTRLAQTNGDNADWEVSGEVREYSFSTVAISNQQSSGNRLTIGVHITIYKRKEDKTEQYDVSRNFDFPASQSIQQAEASLGSEIIRSLTDDIFNRIFSNW